MLIFGDILWRIDGKLLAQLKQIPPACQGTPYHKIEWSSEKTKNPSGFFAAITDVLGVVIYVVIWLPTLNCHMLGIPNENTQSRSQET